MKKTTKILMIIFSFTLIILTACGDDNHQDLTTSVSTNETGESEEVAENHVRITITMDEGSQYVNESEIEIEEGAKLLEVLEENFFVETNDEDEIISIERMSISEEENTSWVLLVDEVESSTPPHEYTLNAGDKITLDLR